MSDRARDADGLEVEVGDHLAGGGPRFRVARLWDAGRVAGWVAEDGFGMSTFTSKERIVEKRAATELEIERGRAWQGWVQGEVWYDTACGIARYFWWEHKKLKRARKENAGLVVKLAAAEKTIDAASELSVVVKNLSTCVPACACCVRNTPGFERVREARIAFKEARQAFEKTMGRAT